MMSALFAKALRPFNSMVKGSYCIPLFHSLAAEQGRTILPWRVRKQAGYHDELVTELEHGLVNQSGVAKSGLFHTESKKVIAKWCLHATFVQCWCARIHKTSGVQWSNFEATAAPRCAPLKKIAHFAHLVRI
jgi:hypothetical protein